MRVAFHTYSTAFRNPGGGEVQLLKTKQYLEKSGVSVDLFDSQKDRLEAYDVLHVFSSVPECLGLMREARSKNIPVVTSTVLWSDWGMAFGAATAGERVRRLAHQAVKWICPVFPSGRRRVLSASDFLLPNSEMEKNQISRYFAIPRSKIRVVPNAVDASFQKADPGPARRVWGKDPFVLCVGRIEPRKNQLNLIRALSKTRRRLVVLGDTVSGYEEYERLCRRVGEGFAEFYPAVSHDDPLLRSAYAACSLFVSPGWFETPGLAALEAALAGARLVVTRGGSTREYFGDLVDYCNPSDPVQMARRVEQNAGRAADPGLRETVHNRFTWESAARATRNAYDEAIALRRG